MGIWWRKIGNFDFKKGNLREKREFWGGNFNFLEGKMGILGWNFGGEMGILLWEFGGKNGDFGSK